MDFFQTITFSILDHKADEDIICRYGETGRFIKLVPDPNEFDILQVSIDKIEFRMFKPDGNFFVKEITDDDGEGHPVLVFDDIQMTAAAGIARYDLAFIVGDDVIYSCDGNIIIDTPIIGDDLIESVSLINGWIFPDDFQHKLTAGQNVFISDDYVISATGGGGGGSYIPGNYITIVNDVIDVATSLINTINGKQDALTAGTYLTISNGVIDITNTLINTINGKQDELTPGDYITITNGVIDVAASLISTISGKQDALTAGTYITITGGVIDVVDTLITTITGKMDSFSTGTYLELTGGVLDVAQGLLDIIDAKQPMLTAGTNITIDADNVISASGGSTPYVAGTYIDITNNVIDVAASLISTINGKQEALTAGTGIAIDQDNVISMDTSDLVDMEVVAEDYDELVTYAAGDYVNYNGGIYQANQAITTPEPWTAAHWTQRDPIMEAIQTKLDAKQNTLIAGTGIGILPDNTIYVSSQEVPMIDDIAEAYDASSTYTAGDYVSEYGNIWKANQAITTPEPFNMAHWDNVVVMDEVRSINSTLAGLSPLLTDNTYTTTNLTFHQYVTLTEGGYYKVGHLVVVNIRLQISNPLLDGTVMIQGLPSMSTTLNHVEMANNQLKHIYVTPSGNVTTGDNVNASALLLSCVYISAN